MRVFILAGGFATRLWPLTEKRSKPLLPLAGKPLITHLIDGLPADLPVTVSTNAVFEDAFRQWAQSIDRTIELKIEGTRKDDHKLGALGALSAWIRAEKIDEDILVLTGDNYLGFRMTDFLEHFTGRPLLAAHDIGDFARASAFGTVIVEGANGTEGAKGAKATDTFAPFVPSAPFAPSQVLAFEEKPREPKTTLVSTGCSILPRSTLPILREYAQTHPDNVGGIFEELLRRNVRVDCFIFKEPWIDIGSFQSYLDAHRTLVGQKAIVGLGTTDVDCHFEGSVAIGSDCRIERSTLTNCIVFDRCQITDCTLQNCVIDDDCVLRGVDVQNQMLRAGTRLEMEN